eukprot:TRINITY_DN1028_c0_g1_i8.p1 TRINITY_DN1028_c0_g1~~TRINITY_DN1028_c0_g1_i8.p1  ORF type:complete len:521 (+),score=119.35 TRINITY_DN1028_c0_g1_i8:125-1687(+)
MQLGVAMHEMTHVLGFSSSKYGEYRNWDILHTPRPSAMVYRTVTRTNPVNQQLYNVDEIILPSVLSKARDQFSCFNNQLTGVQLEDGGGSGTARSHWERRLFKDDYMAGSVPQRPVFSAVSLALLEDTGFYKADYGKAETMGWGNGAGCTFFNGACSEWTLEGYTCSEEGETSCSFDLRDKAVCSVTTFNSALPRKYQHFTTTTKGGSDELADYCPLYNAYSNGDCFSTANYDEVLDRYGEGFGSNSRCFDSTLLNLDGFSISNFRQACYETACKSLTELKVKLGGVWHNCDDETSIKAANFKGLVKCPDTARICSSTSYNSTWPEISSVTPSQVSEAGGTPITIAGSNLAGGDVSVTLAEKTCKVTSASSTQIVCESPVLIQLTSSQSATQLAQGINEVSGSRRKLLAVTRKETVVVKIDGNRYAGPVEGMTITTLGQGALEFFQQMIRDIFGENEVYFYRYWWGLVILLVLMTLCCVYVRKKGEEREHLGVTPSKKSQVVPVNSDNLQETRRNSSMIW